MNDEKIRMDCLDRARDDVGSVSGVLDIVNRAEAYRRYVVHGEGATWDDAAESQNMCAEAAEPDETVNTLDQGYRYQCIRLAADRCRPEHTLATAKAFIAFIEKGEEHNWRYLCLEDSCRIISAGAYANEKLDEILAYAELHAQLVVTDG